MLKEDFMNTFIINAITPPEKEPWWVGAGPFLLVSFIVVVILIGLIILAYSKPKK